jgi:hypothetical protein
MTIGSLTLPFASLPAFRHSAPQQTERRLLTCLVAPRRLGWLAVRLGQLTRNLNLPKQPHPA